MHQDMQREMGLGKRKAIDDDYEELSSPSKMLKKNKHCRASKAKWTADEDELLTRAVVLNGEGNWKKIAQSLGDRSHLQCLHRWQKVLNPALVKGPWKEEEDTKLVELVEKYGPKDWSTIASHIQGRIGKQCRERWFNHLSPEVRKTNWTSEEDRIIIEAHHRLGNKWTAISKLLDGRPANAIKNHWNSTLLKRIQDSNGTVPTRRERKKVRSQVQISTTNFSAIQVSDDESSESDTADSDESIDSDDSPVLQTRLPMLPKQHQILHQKQFLQELHMQQMQQQPQLNYINADGVSCVAWDWPHMQHQQGLVAYPVNANSLSAAPFMGLFNGGEEYSSENMELYSPDAGAQVIPDLIFDSSPSPSSLSSSVSDDYSPITFEGSFDIF